MALVALAIATMIQGQTASAQTPQPAARTVLLSSGPASIPQDDLTRVVREIDDPHNGTRWLLMRNPDHPSGPTVLVMVSVTADGTQQRKPDGPTSVSGAQPLLPVIRAGERLVVEESSPAVEARLEAVSLGPAAIGSPLDVRLKIGGKVMRAVALGPGRAALLAKTKVLP
jgi:hypothetical protein